MITMSRFLTVICSIYSILMFFTLTGAQENQNEKICETSKNGCPVGIGSGGDPNVCLCAMLLNFIYASSSGCAPYFGDSITFTDSGKAFFGLLSSNHRMCDYFDDSTTIDNCYYPNDTLVSNLCFGMFPLIYNLRSNCSNVYTIDPCKIPELGALAINNFVSPENNCVPAPYYNECQLKPSPNPPDYCPNCVVASCSAETSG